MNFNSLLSGFLCVCCPANKDVNVSQTRSGGLELCSLSGQLYYTGIQEVLCCWFFSLSTLACLVYIPSSSTLTGTTVHCPFMQVFSQTILWRQHNHSDTGWVLQFPSEWRIRLCSTVYSSYKSIAGTNLMFHSNKCSHKRQIVWWCSLIN